MASTDPLQLIIGHEHYVAIINVTVLSGIWQFFFSYQDLFNNKSSKQINIDIGWWTAQVVERYCVGKEQTWTSIKKITKDISKSVIHDGSLLTLCFAMLKVWYLFKYFEVM